MSDTSHTHAAPAPVGPTEGDGINYRGLAWFAAILFGTTIACQILMYGMFRVFEHHDRVSGPARSTLAPAEQALPAPPPPPVLLTDEPDNLANFRASEDQILSTYGWIDKNAGVVRLPIDRAKALLLQRGFPARTATAGTQGATDASGGTKTTGAASTKGGGSSFQF
jgi:hypothetical protein